MSNTAIAIVDSAEPSTSIASTSSYEPRHDSTRLDQADIKAYEKERRMVHRAHARAKAKLVAGGNDSNPTRAQVAQEYLYLTGDKR